MNNSWSVLHWHAELPGSEAEFNGQSSQASVAVVAEYLPAVQSVHVPAPVAGLYFPATQAVHVPPLSPEYPVLQMQIVDAVGD